MTILKSKISKIISAKKTIQGMIIDVGNNVKNVDQTNKNSEYISINFSLRDLK
jgi:hypothetical protein